jgi:hypothetical protein
MATRQTAGQNRLLNAVRERVFCRAPSTQSWTFEIEHLRLTAWLRAHKAAQALALSAALRQQRFRVRAINNFSASVDYNRTVLLRTQTCAPVKSATLFMRSPGIW